MPETTNLTYIRAVNEALRWALSADDRVIVFGEDVAVPNGPFGATKGLHTTFGRRVFDTPISETAMVGAALGAAMRGSRPVVEIMYMDFRPGRLRPVRQPGGDHPLRVVRPMAGAAGGQD